MLRMPALAWFGAYLTLIAAAAGCKKPEVEVEEEGPPVPLPAAGESPQPGAAPAPGAPATALPGTIPADEPPVPLEPDAACKLIDEHMTAAGVDIAGRQCSNLRGDGNAIRLDRYLLPTDEANAFEGYNFCLWPDAGGEGWQVGYVDQATSGCVPRETYCKLGAVGVVEDLSAGCPGDAARLHGKQAEALKALVGEWIGTASSTRGERLVVREHGELEWTRDGETTHARFVPRGAGQLDLLADDGAFSVGFAVLEDGSLRFGRGLATASDDPAALYVPLSANLALRRFRGACYEISDPPREFPTPLECPLIGEGEGSEVHISTGSARYYFRRLGKWWLSTDLAPRAFERKDAGEAEDAVPSVTQ